MKPHTFHNRKLAILWQHQLHNIPYTKKPIDGTFIFSSLFSVYAFSTQHNNELMTQFAKKITERMGNELRDFRFSLKQQSSQFKDNIDPIELRPFTPNHEFTMDIDKTHLCPENTMLIKIFMATDAFIIELNKAVFNGELNAQQKKLHQDSLLNALRNLLLALNKTCLSFHQLRKKNHQ